MKQHQYDYTMPWLMFPRSFQIQPQPQVGDSFWRFLVRRSHAPDAGKVSVYLDTTDSLGSMGRPYWEIYPNVDDDTQRFYLGEESEMIAAIGISLSKMERG